MTMAVVYFRDVTGKSIWKENDREKTTAI